MRTTPPLWEATYEAETLDELDAAYSKWAEHYDRDTVAGMGYVGPKLAAAMLDNHLDSKRCRVLDAGCGTGLVGEMLHRLGYQQLDAMDYSRDMLEVAGKKAIYSRLMQQDMNTPLAIPDNSYGAAICVGTFTFAHVGPQAFDELVRITRPGGYICFTVRDGAYEEYDYRPSMLELESSSRWELEELRQADYLVKEEVKAKFFTYRVCGSRA